MAKYLYNGIELPDINTVWTDKETYPYAIINSSSSDYATLQLFENAPYVEGEKVKAALGVSVVYSYYFGVYTEWEYYDEYHNEIDYSKRYAKWTSHDLVDENNQVYLAASEPVPVPDEPEPVLSWQKHDAYKPNSKSIAYLYNGVELPDINTVWTDKATYPCAIITRGIPNGTYYLTVCGDKPYYTEQAHSTDGYEPIVVAPKPFNGFGYVVGSWVLYIEDTGYGAALHTGTFELIWTNVDVMNKDNGSVYFNGSDPVIKGWDGNTFYRVMGGKWVKQDGVVPTE